MKGDDCVAERNPRDGGFFFNTGGDKCRRRKPEVYAIESRHYRLLSDVFIGFGFDVETFDDFHFEEFFDVRVAVFECLLNAAFVERIRRLVKIAITDLPALSGQIGVALASGDYVILLGGLEYQTTKKILGEIRRDFDSYTAGSGVSDAQAVRGGAAILSQSESPSGDTETKASAPQGNASAARQISDSEPTPSSKRPRFPRSYVRRNSKISKIAAESIGSALREELEPVLDTLDDIGAMLSGLLAERAIDRAPKQPRGWRKCTVENPLGGVIRTKHGRTSVVVGVRKVAKFQPKTKGKSK